LQEEVAAARGAIIQLGGQVEGLQNAESFSDNGQRTVLVVRKLRPTPARFPRAVGVPRKQPL
jgi:16S rRNA (guanine527-N7)-methyltransferase